MHILVTGGGGFVGSRLVRRLKNNGVSVVCLRRQSAAGSPLDRREAVFDAEVKEFCSRGDLRVVHLGWDVQRRGDWTVQSNCVAESARLFAYVSTQPRQLIVLGSAEEYGRREGRLNEEDMPLLPLSAYGWAKQATRELVQSWRTAETAVLWLRPFLVYGPGQTGSMLIPTAITAAEQRRPAAFSDGAQRRDFVHVEDVVDAIVLGLDRCPSGMEVVNIGTGEPVAVKSVLEQLALLFDASGLFSIGGLPRRVGEPDLQVANPQRAAELIGWRARTDWRAGLLTLRAAHSPS